MKLVQLKYFVDVCKSGSFVSASKLNCVSQPAIAQSVKELEEEFCVRLFDRNNNKISLTEDGQWLLAKAENLLAVADNLEKGLHARSDNRNFVRLAVAPMFGSLYFYEAIDSFRTAYPDIRIEVEEAGSLDIRKWLENNTVDIGIGVLEGIQSKKLATLKLVDVPLCFCVRKDHPLANRTSLKFSDLKGVKICLLRQDSYQNSFIQQQFDKECIPLDVAIRSSQLSSISSMLMHSDCGAFLFENIQKENNSIVAIPMDLPICLPIGFLWDVRQKNYPQIETLRKYFYQQFQKKQGQ